MNFTNVWKTNTTQTASGSHLQLQTQNIPLHGVVRTMNRRRPDAPKLTRRNDIDVGESYQIPLPFIGPGGSIIRTQKPASPTPASPSARITTFLDSTFQFYSERVQMELTNLRAVCTKAIFREQQATEKWKAHCVTFKQERDIARERVKVLMGEREAQADANRLSLREVRRSRSSGAFPPTRQRLSMRAPPRSASLPSSPSTATAVPQNNADSLSLPTLSRRPSSSSKASRPASPTSSWSDTAFSEPENDPTFYALSYPSPRPSLSPLDATPSARLLSPPVTLQKRSHSAGPILARSSECSSSSVPRRDVTRGGQELNYTYAAPIKKVDVPHAPSSRPPPVQVSAETTELAPSPSSPGSSLPTRDSLLKRIPAVRRVELQLDHVDVMYISHNGRLECRACRLAQSKLSPSAQAKRVPTSFSMSASSDDLLDHCLMQHPGESRDVAQLQPAGISELRRRLKQVAP